MKSCLGDFLIQYPYDLVQFQIKSLEHGLIVFMLLDTHRGDDGSIVDFPAKKIVIH